MIITSLFCSAASLLGGLILGSVLVILESTRAEAAVFCGHYWVETVRTDGSGNWVFHRGSRATTPDGMRVIDDASIACARVSSIILYSDGNNWVEVGALEWNYSNIKNITCINGTSTSVPRRLVIMMLNGLVYCFPSSGAPPSLSSAFHEVMLANASLDGDIDVYVDGTSVHTWTTGWDTGISMANTERFETSDSQWGNFRKMEFQNGTGWHEWTNRNCWYDNTFDWDTTTGDLGIPAHVMVEKTLDGHTCDNRSF